MDISLLGDEAQKKCNCSLHESEKCTETACAIGAWPSAQGDAQDAKGHFAHLMFDLLPALSFVGSFGIKLRVDTEREDVRHLDCTDGVIQSS